MVRSRREGSPEPGLATLGERLRRARTARGLSLRAIARRIGVSPSLISQVETGRAKPSVSTLYALAAELGISLDELMFMDAPPPVAEDEAGTAAAATIPDDPVQRADSRASISLGSGVLWERLTTESLRNVDFLYVTYEVGGASSPADAFQRHKGQEWGYVLSGTLHVNIGFDEYDVGPGDAITFDSAVPHRLSNQGEEPVRAIWFVMGRGTADSPAADRRSTPGGRQA